MNKEALHNAPREGEKRAIDIVRKGLRRRYAAERRFRRLGVAVITISLLFLFLLLASIVSKGYSAFRQTYIRLHIVFDPEVIDRNNPGEADFAKLVRNALRRDFPEVTGRQDLRDLFSLLSRGADTRLRQTVLDHPELIGGAIDVWLQADDEIDMLIKGHVSRNTPESDRRLNDRQIAWVDALTAQGRVEQRFNRTFFTAGDSREPELAGIRGAVSGSFLTLLVTLIFSFPIGVAAAVYLEEFAPKNRWTDLIEVNINNLAAVPSIVFGLLGLAVFINFFGLPRSASLVGGLVLALMTLPIIIIAGRAALKSVPPSIREAALGVGASKMQVVFHHVLPLAMPGMLTGTIIGMAHALGETAPLLMIGMVAFIVDVPGNIFDPAAVLPVQVYLWADSPERAFVEKTSAAIMVLLVFLFAMNSLAVFLRKRFERRW